MRPYPRRDILGCPFDAVSFDETLAEIRRALTAGGRLQIVPGNIDFVMKARRDPGFARDLRAADLVVADGVPVVWAAALLGRPLCGRVSGTDLVIRCAAIAAETGRAVAVVGGVFDLSARAAQRLTARFPAARIVALPTPFPLTAAAGAALAGQIRALGAGIVLVALGAPRQERWVRGHLADCGANVGIGVGSALDIISGAKPRAPRLLRDNGLEWLCRLIQDPGRLGRRYLFEDSPFLAILAWHLARRRLGR